ncbi:MAG: hypothetical protein GY778_13240 [bacterium]|nr:hypothetical protein [bacterium]
MSRPPQRWPIWKIATAALVCLASAAGLLWLSFVASVPPPEESTPQSQPMMTLSTLLVMLSVAMAMLGVLALGWLAHRIRDDRIPAWEKRDRPKRRRRR